MAFVSVTKKEYSQRCQIFKSNSAPVWTSRVSVEFLISKSLLKSNMLVLNSNKIQSSQYLITRTNKKNQSCCNICYSICKNQFAFTKTFGTGSFIFFREGIHRIICVLKCISYHIKDECCNLFSMAQRGKL